MTILRLAISSPLRQLFDYLPPLEVDPNSLRELPAGCRIMVPFGSREVCGLVVEVAASSDQPQHKMRHALSVLDHTALISKTLLDLCRWAASYYKHPLGEILMAALPTNLRQGQPHRLLTTTHWRLSVAGKGLPTDALQRAPRQAQLLRLLQERDSATTQTLREAGISSACQRQMLAKGLIESSEQVSDSTPATRHSGPQLNAEQGLAVEAIADSLGTFACFLLQGVTGSGKTEVYLRLIEQVLAAGRQVLILVPEIGLTPQTIARFQQRFAANIVVLHSGIAEGARYDAWEAARSGQADIVIGTRSAVFASLSRPGLIVVDEEHDLSFKQQEGFRYSARDLAVKRGQLENIPVILGSATPSLESIHNAVEGRYQRLLLEQRAGGSELPMYQIMDIRHRPLLGGIGEDLLHAVRAEIKAGNQVLLFLNRRGFAHCLQCHDCGHVAGCLHCDARLTVHRRAGELRCHHCGFKQAIANRCPQCNSQALNSRGVGTEQAELVLQQQFPGITLHRVDRDTMQARGAMQHVVTSVANGEPCILLGTQMLTKGHHFPDVTLVGLLDTDGSLFSPDFRGAERMGQLLIQVGGRAGRADKPGRVIVQTHYPDHPLLNLLLAKGYGHFAEQLLAERAQTQLPPFGQLLLLRADASQMQQAEDFLQQIKNDVTQQPAKTVSCVGPLPAPLQRRNGRFRAQLLVICNSRRVGQRIGDQLVAVAEALPLGKKLRWSLDVDPQDML